MTRAAVLGAVAAVVWPALSGCGGPSRAGMAPAASGGLASSTRGVGTEAPHVTSDRAASNQTAAAGTLSPAPATEGVVEATFDDIKFPMEKTERFDRAMLTPKVESLFGKRIRIRGYMYPTLRKKGLTQFVLVRDNMECCFGPGAALFDCILVTMAPGKTAEYSIRPIAVEGEFRLEELPGPDGRPLAIYQMRGEAVATGG
jgi:hypothetical protein